MSKPKLKVDAMVEELGAVASFALQKPPVQPQVSEAPTLPKKVEYGGTKATRKAVTPHTRLTPDLAAKHQQKIERLDSNNDTVTPRHHDTTQSIYQDDTIESIRKAVKHLGKEAATYRFTQEEKKALADIIYDYKAKGIKTSENEVTRTAINFLVEDYRENGGNSVLEKVIERLNE